MPDEPQAERFSGELADVAPGEWLADRSHDVDAEPTDGVAVLDDQAVEGALRHPDVELLE